MNECDIYYLAAAVDYEGAIGISKNVRKSGIVTYNAYVSVGNTEKELLQPLVDAFGGNIAFRRVQKANHSNMWVWISTGYIAVDIVNAIKHALKSERKIKLVDVLSRWAYSYGTDINSKRRKLYTEAKELNVRGNRNHDIIVNRKISNHSSKRDIRIANRKSAPLLGVSMEGIHEYSVENFI